jgi:hypothetical protein
LKLEVQREACGDGNFPKPTSNLNRYASRNGWHISNVVLRSLTDFAAESTFCYLLSGQGLFASRSLQVHHSPELVHEALRLSSGSTKVVQYVKTRMASAWSTDGQSKGSRIVAGI